jgi:hypothetical protein
MPGAEDAATELAMYYPTLKERFQRVLGLPQRVSSPSTGLKTVLLIGLLALIGLLGALANRSPTLAHLRVAILSGSERGNYYAVVSALAAEAQQQQGHIDNLASVGSVENVSRLIAAKTACNIHFALVQEGMDSGLPATRSSSLVASARLSRSCSSARTPTRSGY